MLEPARNTGRLDIALESSTESADLAESLVIEFSSKAGYDEQQCQEIGLAVRESVINAVLHGNCCDANKKVGLKVELSTSCLTISIRDEGEGFDIDCVPDPLVSSNLLHASGRGIFMVKALMDEVSVRRTHPCGTELTMIKHLSLREDHKMSLKTSTRQVDGVTVLDLSGRIVLGDGSNTLRDTLKDLLNRGQKKVLLNLAEVNYIDSSGLGALVSGYTTLTGQQGQMKLLNLTTKVHDLLQITKLLTVFEVFTDENTAIKSFR